MPRRNNRNNNINRGTPAGGSAASIERIPECQRGMTYDERIAHCTQFMVHASKCQDANCDRPACSEMKRFVNHNKQCRNAWNGQCAPCKKGILVCMYHSKTCRDFACEVPHCLEMRLVHPEVMEGSSSDVHLSQLAGRR